MTDNVPPGSERNSHAYHRDLVCLTICILWSKWEKQSSWSLLVYQTSTTHVRSLESFVSAVYRSKTILMWCLMKTNYMRVVTGVISVPIVTVLWFDKLLPMTLRPPSYLFPSSPKDAVTSKWGRWCLGCKNVQNWWILPWILHRITSHRCFFLSRFWYTETGASVYVSHSPTIHYKSSAPPTKILNRPLGWYVPGMRTQVRYILTTWNSQNCVTFCLQ